MTENRRRSEKGQALIQVAILMVVLLAFAALAIDFGRIYLERRFLQNGADSGALAGARAMCFDYKTYEEVTAPGGPAEVFAKQNVPNPGDTVVEFPAPPNPWTVVVTARENALPTFLAAVVGMDTVTVGATAAAACGPADNACGLFPIALKQVQWDPMETQCGRPFYVWTGDYDPGDPASGPDCSVCNCDTDPAWPGNEVLTELGRGWLDFSEVVDPLYPSCAQPGCGESELECWIREGDPAPLQIPACVGGDTGIKTGAKDDIESRAGDIVKIPIFDELCTAPNCKYGFHVIKFGCVTVAPLASNEPWDSKLELKFKTPPATGPDKCWWGKVVKVSVTCKDECNTACGGTIGGGCPVGSSAVCAVNLIE